MYGAPILRSKRPEGQTVPLRRSRLLIKGDEELVQTLAYMTAQPVSQQHGGFEIDQRGSVAASTVSGLGSVARRMTPVLVDKPALGAKSRDHSGASPPIPSEIYIRPVLPSPSKPAATFIVEEDDVSTPDAAVNPNERQRFVLFFRILVVHMSRTVANHTQKLELHRRIKAIVSECIASPSGSTTQKLERKLRKYVGEQHWQCCQDRFDAFCRRRGLSLR